MSLDPKKYTSDLWQGIEDPKAKRALMDLAQKVERLARDTNSSIDGIPDGFPSGAIVFWIGDASTIPAGWSRVTALDGRFPRGMTGATGAGATGGSDTHLHYVDLPNTDMGPASISVGVAAGSSYNVAKDTHKHSVDTYSDQASSLPSYLDGLWIRKD